MTQMWGDTGDPVPVLDNEVVNVRTKEKEGYWGLQVGGVNHPKPKNLLKPVLGQYTRAGVVPKRKLWEFRVTEDAVLPVGMAILASHFVCGQYVDVCAKSTGKGFQGVMKRHGMKGQPASHGQTKTHRKMGATGGAQDPGRIWPGKRMPGRMGGKRVTTPSLQVVRVNQRFGVMYVRGAVPGHKNTFVRVTDARRKPHTAPPPFPTHYPELDNEGAGLREEGEEFSSVRLPQEDSLHFPDRYAREQ
jgi:large subunit ribosomal protein L3